MSTSKLAGILAVIGLVVAHKDMESYDKDKLRYCNFHTISAHPSL